MEKTFEELIEESEYSYIDDGNDTFMYDSGILELMQQVREATIAECRDIALQDDVFFVGDITGRIESLPTDRITITENIINYGNV